MATPPVESKRFLLWKTACGRKDKRAKNLLVIDALKAHLHPRCQDDLFIDLEGGEGNEREAKVLAVRFQASSPSTGKFICSYFHLGQVRGTSLVVGSVDPPR